MPVRIDTEIPDLVVLESSAHGDERGFLLESFREDAWSELGVAGPFVQENHSRSSRGILRGIHFQTSPGQGKLVRCVRGAVWDLAVDLRPQSPTFRRWQGFELSDANHRQVYVPVGFGHGFCVLSDVADVAYKLTSYYDPATEAGIRWDDPDIGVEWPVTQPQLSERDMSAPALADVEPSLPW